MTAWDRIASLTVSTRRHSQLTGGKRGEAIPYLTGVKCIPFMPVDAELRQRMAIDTPHEVLQTFVEGTLDIREGDYLVHDDKLYPVRAVAEWPWRDFARKHLILEDLK